MDMKHMEYLEEVAQVDIAELKRKESTYQGSWKKRGGVGAWFVTIRKYDRLEQIVSSGFGYDIFAALGTDLSGKDGSALAELRDLRRYLLLIESEMHNRITNRNFPIDVNAEWEANRPGTPDNGGHHAELEGPKGIPRLSDGLPHKDIEPELRDFYMTTSSVSGLQIVDRRIAPTDWWEHLPRLRIELNNKEYEESLAEYHGLYKWIGTDNKWVMREQYREHWGMEP